jgi:hypothetical protein
MMFVMAVDPGSIFRAVLREQDMQLKEAAILMDCDLGHLCRAVKGDAPLDLHKLTRLPWRIVAPFWSKFIAAFADNELHEMRAEKLLTVRVVQQVKAELRSTTEQKRSA